MIIRAEGTHTSIELQQGGRVGIKEMVGFDGVKRLAVRTPGTDGAAAGIGSAYLTKEECEEVARLIAPHLVAGTGKTP